MSQGDTIPLYASSQSDIDEIETLFHVSQQPAMSLPASVPPARPSSPPPAATAPPPLPPRTPVPFVSASVKPAASTVDVPAPVPPNLSSNGPTGFGGGPGNNTLTEPVWTTIKRDVVRVSINLRSVVFPNPFREDPGKALRDWDLWGPFFFIVFLGVAISYSASTDNSKVFAVVFAVLAAGAVILTLNVLLLGGHIIFFQSLSLLGYCLFPLDIGALICMFRTHAIIRGIIVLLTLAWSSWAAYPFVSAAVSPNRKALAVYPVFLLYVSIGFFIFAV